MDNPLVAVVAGMAVVPVRTIGMEVPVVLATLIHRSEFSMVEPKMVLITEILITINKAGIKLPIKQ